MALDTADWMVRELRTTEGGFASALDADTDGVEGLTYVWTPAQLVEVLGNDDGRWAADLLTVTAGGTFEDGASTLQLRTDPDDWTRWESVRERLLAARDERPQPARDDKVVTAWNGLAVAALAEAGALLDRPDLVAAATSTADLLGSVHLVDGRLRRVSRDGVAGAHPGVLEDYADLAEGLLALVAVTGDAARLQLAGELLDVVLTRFPDDDGGFHDTADDRADPRLASMRRPQDPTDNATPSGQAAAAGALLTYAAYTGSVRHREAAERALAVYAPLAAGHARFAGWGLAVAEALADGPREVAVVGRRADPATAALHRTALLGTAPGAAVVVGDPDDRADGVPLLIGPAAARREADRLRVPALRLRRTDDRRGGAGNRGRQPPVTAEGYRVRDLTEDDLDEIATWTYDGPWSVYDSDGRLDPTLGYWAVVGAPGERLAGFGCLGEDARVRGLPRSRTWWTSVSGCGRTWSAAGPGRPSRRRSWSSRRPGRPRRGSGSWSRTGTRAACGWSSGSVSRGRGPTRWATRPTWCWSGPSALGERPWRLRCNRVIMLA